MAGADKTLTCRECGSQFVFTAGEQEFYRSRGLLNEPGRCPTCRSNRRQARGGRSDGLPIPASVFLSIPLQIIYVPNVTGVMADLCACRPSCIYVLFTYCRLSQEKETCLQHLY